MKHPGTYTDAQWQAIRGSLVGVGINPDTAVASWKSREGPLPETLQRMAQHFATVASGIERDMARQSKRGIGRLQTRLAALQATLAVLDDDENKFHLGGLAVLGGAAGHDRCRAATAELRTAARHAAELTASLARLQPHLAQLTRWRGRPNAGTAHNELWAELTRVWQALTGRRRHKDLLKFLVACSEPLFPAATTDKKLTAFIERNFPQTKT